MKYVLSGMIALLVSINSFSQIPPGYYDDADGLLGDSLRMALRDIIDGHTSVSYASLWTHFQNTDVKGNGKVWDMYSDIPNDVPPYEYTFVTDQCGNYGQEGDCYNREHSFPKSWFGNVAPMATDLFHLYPTDGYVNGHRSNLPYGEVSSPSWTSQNGSKNGSNTYPGSTGNAFEPIFEYRGDFARTYFYMVTRYMDQVSSWNSSMLSGDDLSTWAMNMLMDWHDDDPVSQKEIDRNDEVYAIQGNRNPFIDHPEYVSNIYDPTLLIKEHSEMNSFVYESVFHFREERELQSFRVYSVVGQELVNLAEPNRKDIELNELKDGVYIIVFSTAGREYLLRFRK